MATYSTKETITAALERFNQRAYNAGLYFKIDSIDPHSVYVLASFDFAYYVNVTLDFRDVFYTNLKPDQNWPDAWHSDQLFLLETAELAAILMEFANEEAPPENMFGFLFNINGRENKDTGMILCKSLAIQWQSPAYED